MQSKLKEDIKTSSETTSTKLMRYVLLTP